MNRKLNKYLKVALLSLTFFFMATSISHAAPTEESTTIDRVFQYSGLESKKAIQSFDYGDSNEVFVTQREGSDTVLSRCEVSGATCEVKDSVTLKDFGHGESLEVIKEGDKTLIWIGNTANTEDDHRWSTDISLVEYNINPDESSGAEVTNVKTFTNLEGVAPEQSGSAHRSAVAIADGSDRIAFRIQIGTAAKDTYYAIYKLSEVTEALQNSSSDNVDIEDISELQITHFTGLDRPNNSFQGFDIKGVGSGNKFIYMFGGVEGETPTIYKYSYTNGGNYEHVKTIEIKGGYVGSLEAEGIKVEDDPNNPGTETVFIGLKPGLDDDGNLKPFRLYSFTE